MLSIYTPHHVWVRKDPFFTLLLYALTFTVPASSIHLCCQYSVKLQYHQYFLYSPAGFTLHFPTPTSLSLLYIYIINYLDIADLPEKRTKYLDCIFYFDACNCSTHSCICPSGQFCFIVFFKAAVISTGNNYLFCINISLFLQAITQVWLTTRL